MDDMTIRLSVAGTRHLAQRRRHVCAPVLGACLQVSAKRCKRLPQTVQSSLVSTETRYSQRLLELGQPSSCRDRGRLERLC